MSYSCSDFLDDVMRCLVHSEVIADTEIPDADPGKASDVATAAIVTMRGAGLSSRFVLEVLNSVETLGDIVEEHGVTALAFLFTLQAAILTGSSVDGRAEVDEHIVALVARLPSATDWMKHVRTGVVQA